MIRHLELFQTELDDPYDDNIRAVVTGRRMDRSSTILGRCKRCGADFSNTSQFCAECLGTEYCSCYDCMQIASIHQMLLDKVYWLNQEHFKDWEARQYARGKDYEYIARGLAASYRSKELQLASLKAKAAKYRNLPFCREVAA